MIVGLDVGGTKTLATAFDCEFNQIAELRVPTVTDSLDAVTGLIIQTVKDLTARFTGRTLTSIGVGVPGLVDRNRGLVRQAVHLGIGDKPLHIGDKLTDAFHVRCYVDNDVNVAALGAYRIMTAESVSDLAYLSIGTGLAAGVIQNGRLHQGHRGVAGEIGHFPIFPDGRLCECGLRGCLETVASGNAITRRWPGSDGMPPAESLVTQANAGNQQARAVLESIADHLAKAVYLLAITYDVDRIVIGGGVADVGDPLLQAIKDGIRRLEVQSGFVRSLELRDRVLLKPPGPVGAIGAAALAHRGL